MSRPLWAAIAAIGIGVPAIAHADRTPMMDHARAVSCMRDKAGDVWRIQCDHASKVCLYAPDAELDSDGNRVRALERARDCDGEQVDRPKLEGEGYTFVAGRVDAPWGWMRDERGRVFQINFDLTRRLYFGFGYTPRKILDNVNNPFEHKRSSADFGFSVEFLTDEGSRNPTRHRIRLLDGSVKVAPFSSELTVAHYDLSHRFIDPLLRITTFVGEPARHDLTLDLGLWTEAGGLEIHPTQTGHYSTLWRHATGQITLDLWQSAKMDSYARIRAGFGLEGQHTDEEGYRSALTQSSAFEWNWIVDSAGFHNLKLELVEELPRYFVPVVNGGQKQGHRLFARMQYEAIVLAINDQPLTLKVGAAAEKRDDIFGVPNRWALVMDAGLRFNLWAPPRPAPGPHSAAM